ncbi:hypothetical protein [Halorubrum laminariae]|uniref:Intracellular proteinase inhibitor BsuPI domain-containing protein n=1 Tax=Halorubrum laminariae TaxID=1433523 RepID=A0ABD6BX27_9EURY|nr:hypothetical protein [Halorubrum laminariae]
MSVVALSGCSASFNYSSDSDSPESEKEPENTSTGESDSNEVENEDIEKPVIEEISLQYDDEWLMLSRRYKTPYYGDEFLITEQWTIESDDLTLEKERDQHVEPDSTSDVVWVDQSMWMLNRWDNEIQAGEYEVTLVLESQNGDQSDPVSETISILE